MIQRADDDRTMIGMLKPESANYIPKTGGIKVPPDRFRGAINWFCAFCGTLLVSHANEQYAEHGLPCYKCGEWNRTPYQDEKR